MRPNVTAIGCFTNQWERQMQITERVHRELDGDPTLLPVLQRAVAAHGKKLPRVMARGSFVETIAYLRRRKPNACVIASHCTRGLVFQTIIDFGRVPSPR